MQLLGSQRTVCIRTRVDAHNLRRRPGSVVLLRALRLLLVWPQESRAARGRCPGGGKRACSVLSSSGASGIASLQLRRRRSSSLLLLSRGGCHCCCVQETASEELDQPTR